MGGRRFTYQGAISAVAGRPREPAPDASARLSEVRDKLRGGELKAGRDKDRFGTRSRRPGCQCMQVKTLFLCVHSHIVMAKS